MPAEPFFKPAIADVAASQPEEGEAVGQAKRHEILVLADQDDLLLLHECGDAQVGRRLVAKILYVGRKVAALSEPCAQPGGNCASTRNFIPPRSGAALRQSTPRGKRGQSLRLSPFCSLPRRPIFQLEPFHPRELPHVRGHHRQSARHRLTRDQQVVGPDRRALAPEIGADFRRGSGIFRVEGNFGQPEKGDPLQILFDPLAL
jgi:hypothetical protein